MSSPFLLLQGKPNVFFEAVTNKIKQLKSAFSINLTPGYFDKYLINGVNFYDLFCKLEGNNRRPSESTGATTRSFVIKGRNTWDGLRHNKEKIYMFFKFRQLLGCVWLKRTMQLLTSPHDGSILRSAVRSCGHFRNLHSGLLVASHDHRPTAWTRNYQIHFSGLVWTEWKSIFFFCRFLDYK